MGLRPNPSRNDQQILLVGLIEDARIEALALRRFPGLRHVWAPFHTAEPTVLRTAPILFVRLDRALFDPAYADQDGFVTKGRALFVTEPDPADPALSRRIGGLLGYDIGQMRIGFNARTFATEPVYRDDNLWFWALQSPDAPSAAIDQPAESVLDQKRSLEHARRTARRLQFQRVTKLYHQLGV